MELVFQPPYEQYESPLSRNPDLEFQAAIGTTRYSQYLTPRAYRYSIPSAKRSTWEKSRNRPEPTTWLPAEVESGGRRSGFSCQAEQIATLSGHFPPSRSAQPDESPASQQTMATPFSVARPCLDIHDFKPARTCEGARLPQSHNVLWTGDSVRKHCNLKPGARTTRRQQLEASASTLLEEPVPGRWATPLYETVPLISKAFRRRRSPARPRAQIAPIIRNPDFPSWRPAARSRS